MKKLLFLLPMAMLAFCLSACSDDEDDIAPDTPVNPDTPTSLGFSVTASMIEVDGLTEECTVAVNNTACTVEIALALVDAEQLSALEVSIVNLPDGATASPSSFTADFSGGQTTSVTFSNDGYDVDFVFSASVTGTPSFTSLTLDGVDALSGTVTLPEESDVTAVKVEFVTDPEGTTVTVGSTTVNSGDTVDFTEAVTFTLDFAGYTSQLTVTATAAGEEEEPGTEEPVDLLSLIKLERVWGEYTGSDGATVTGLDVANYRSIAMDDTYMYVPTASGTGGMTAISIATKEIKTMSISGISGGTHATSQALVVENGSSTKLLVCNLVNDASQSIKVYSYDSVDSEPVEVLSYAAGKTRYGDKFSYEGDWNSGTIYFYNATGDYRGEVLAFSVSNGTVNATPTTYTVDADTHQNTASYGGVYHYKDNEYLFASAGIRFVATKLNGTTFTYDTPAPANSSNYVGSENPAFFTFNGYEYMAYAQIEANYDIVVCVEDFEYESLADNIGNLRFEGTLQDYGLCVSLGNSDGSYGFTSQGKNGNALAGLDVRTINGTTYIAAVAPQVGIALYKVEAAD